jgi:flagellar basal body-associated protein FliL
MVDTETAGFVDKKPKAWLNLLVCAAVGFVSGGMGFMTMMFLTSEPATDPAKGRQAVEMAQVFLPFGGVSCNIGDGQLNRFLRVTITLQFECPKDDTAKQTEELQKLLDFNKPILTSWLLSYLSDMKMDDIRGAVGQNRLRREIQNQFSTVLFPDGDRQVQNLLFEEFIVQ